jgi:hypothetical protein
MDANSLRQLGMARAPDHDNASYHSAATVRPEAEERGIDRPARRCVGPSTFSPPPGGMRQRVSTEYDIVKRRVGTAHGHKPPRGTNYASGSCDTRRYRCHDEGSPKPQVRLEEKKRSEGEISFEHKSERGLAQCPSSRVQNTDPWQQDVGERLLPDPRANGISLKDTWSCIRRTKPSPSQSRHFSFNGWLKSPDQSENRSWNTRKLVSDPSGPPGTSTTIGRGDCLPDGLAHHGNWHGC